MTDAQATRFFNALKTIAHLETIEAKQDLEFSKLGGNNAGVAFFSSRIDRISKAIKLTEKGAITAHECLAILAE